MYEMNAEIRSVPLSISYRFASAISHQVLEVSKLFVGLFTRRSRNFQQTAFRDVGKEDIIGNSSGIALTPNLLSLEFPVPHAFLFLPLQFSNIFSIRRNAFFKWLL